MLFTILLVLLILVLIGALPTWPHSRTWGWSPGAVIAVILLVIVILMLTGRIEPAWAQGAVEEQGPVAEAIIDLSPLYDEVIKIVAVILMTVAGVLATWIGAKLAKLLGLKSDAQVRPAVERALQAGIVYAVNEAHKLSDRVDEVPVKNVAVAAAANYVLRHVPDALAQLGVVDPKAPKGERYAKLEDVVRARLEEYLAGTLPPPPSPDAALAAG